MKVADLFDLTGRKALITGGSRGLGLQIAEALGESGCHVILAARKQPELEQAVRGLADQSISADYIVADLSTSEGVAKLGDEVAAQQGMIDILVNNAGAVWLKAKSVPGCR